MNAHKAIQGDSRVPRIPPMIGTHGPNNAKVTARRALLVLLGLAAIYLTAPVILAQPSANKVLVANVYFEGVRNIPIDKAMLYVHTKPGQEYSDMVAQKDIERLAASHLCKPLTVRTDASADGRVNVIFVVREFRSIVRDVVFKHAKHVEVKELQTM